MALLGPSGSGKTTLLRIIAGLEAPDSGSVLFHGEDATNADVRDRNVGFVFQHYALFRHMTVFENVAFGLRVRPKPNAAGRGRDQAQGDAAAQAGAARWLADRYPHQLSGGQRQRVALARALAVEPKVLLLDEPFGALDAKVRKELRRWLRRLHDEMHVTSVFVTHDQEEAMEVADRVVVMNQGRIEQQGSPDEVYDHPATPFVLQFLGDVNLFHGRIGQRGAPPGRELRAPARTGDRGRGRRGHLAGDAEPDADRRAPTRASSSSAMAQRLHGCRVAARTSSRAARPARLRARRAGAPAPPTRHRFAAAALGVAAIATSAAASAADARSDVETRPPSPWTSACSTTGASAAARRTG